MRILRLLYRLWYLALLGAVGVVLVGLAGVTVYGVVDASVHGDPALSYDDRVAADCERAWDENHQHVDPWINHESYVHNCVELRSATDELRYGD